MDEGRKASREDIVGRKRIYEILLLVPVLAGKAGGGGVPCSILHTVVAIFCGLITLKVVLITDAYDPYGP